MFKNPSLCSSIELQTNTYPLKDTSGNARAMIFLTSGTIWWRIIETVTFQESIFRQLLYETV